MEDGEVFLAFSILYLLSFIFYPPSHHPIVATY